MRIVGKIISCILALGIFGGAAYFTYKKVAAIGKNEPATEVLSGDEVLGDGKVMLPGVAHNAPSSLAVFSESADKAKDKPLVILDASNKLNTLADWSVTYVESGEDASDAISVKPTSSGSLQAQVKFKKSFDEQIKLEVKSRTSDEALNCTVDCISPLQFGGCYLCATDFDECADIGIKMTSGTGTVAPAAKIKEAWLSLNEDFQKSLCLFANENIKFKSLQQVYSNMAAIVKPSENITYHETVGGIKLNYNQFILGWEDYSEEMQNTIKNSWMRAYEVCNAGNMVLLDIAYDLVYGEYKLAEVEETELPGGFISGEYYAPV